MMSNKVCADTVVAPAVTGSRSTAQVVPAETLRAALRSSLESASGEREAAA
jgi:hypothetical protein